MKTSYEWDIETTDEHGDITDHNHRDKLREFGGSDFPLGPLEVLVLVRDVWGPASDEAREEMGDADLLDLDQRSWAYITQPTGKLPEAFDSGEIVPERFHKELARAKRRLGWQLDPAAVRPNTDRRQERSDGHDIDDGDPLRGVPSFPAGAMRGGS